MPMGKYKSRKFRRVHTRVPGGKSVLHYKERKPSAPHCAKTGEVLHGIPRVRTSEMKKLSKTERRPQRPFGGVLSSRAMRSVFKQKARTGDL